MRFKQPLQHMPGQIVGTANIAFGYGRRSCRGRDCSEATLFEIISAVLLSPSGLGDWASTRRVWNPAGVPGLGGPSKWCIYHSKTVSLMVLS
ncbi:hypothetical protein OH77DRAFT_1309586 [Trametes cingulata]|nr:hypothetical protein OH77DRAFT_1309586 [Trametes cingulata]